MSSQPNPNDELREKIHAAIHHQHGIEVSCVKETENLLEQLHAHMQAMVQDVIGEDHPIKDEADLGSAEDWRNGLRAEQRQRVNKWIGGSDGR